MIRSYQYSTPKGTRTTYVGIVIILMLSHHGVGCLECYSCTHMSVNQENSNSTQNKETLLQNLVSNTHCQLKDEADKENISTRQCEQTQIPRDVMKCVSIRGTVESKAQFKHLGTQQVNVDTIIRTCVKVRAKHPIAQDGCHTKISRSAKLAMKKIFQDTRIELDLKLFKFNGQVCFDTKSKTDTLAYGTTTTTTEMQAITTPQLGSLECYNCGYMRLLGSKTWIYGILHGLIKSYSNKHCQMRNLSDEDKLEKRTCPVAAAGKVAKCASVSGKVTTAVTMPIIGKHPITTYTISRDCIEVDRDHSITTDGCHNTIAPAVHAKIREFFSTRDTNKIIDLENMKYTGKACFTSEGGTDAMKVDIDKILEEQEKIMEAGNETMFMGLNKTMKNLFLEMNASGNGTQAIENLILEMNASGNETKAIANLILEMNASRNRRKAIENLILEMNASGNGTQAIENLILEMNASGNGTKAIANLILEMNASGNGTKTIANLILEMNATGNETVMTILQMYRDSLDKNNHNKRKRNSGLIRKSNLNKRNSANTFSKYVIFLWWLFCFFCLITTT